MARRFNFFTRKNAGKACAAYPDHHSLLEALQREEAGAIQCLSSRVCASIAAIGKAFGLSDEDVEELQCDCIILFIQKLRSGAYVYRGHDPASFVIEIAKKRVRHYERQAKRRQTKAPAPAYDPADEESAFGGSEENARLLEELFLEIDENCRKLISLKYLEELRDKEIIEMKLTQYTTVNAVKTHRSKCMKQLAEALAARQKKVEDYE